LKLFRLYPLLILCAAACGDKDVDNKPVANIPAPNNKPVAPINNEVEAGKDDALEIKQENFINGVNNPYFSIRPGRKYFFDGVDPRGIKIHKELLASDQEREIAGVKTLATWTREWHDNSLVSDNKSWYAQDKEGNVWLFGEKNLDIFGSFIKGKGSEWLAGENDAKAGIIVPASAKVGDEIATAFNGIDQEKAEVLGIGEKVQTPKGELSDCLKIRDYSIGEHPSESHNYYCKESGNLSLELVPDTFGKIELTRIEDNFSTAGMNLTYPELKVSLTEAKAKEIALEKVPASDEVTALNIVLRNDDPVYAIDILDEEKDTTRVFLDLNSGKVLSTEKIKK
jgi:hypothetical protein